MENTLAVTKALADGNRMRVLMALIHRKELCVCQIIELLALAPATVSRHMSIMQTAHLVESRKQGKWVYFRLSDKLPSGLLDWLERGLLDSTQIHSDTERLNKILETDPDALCRTRKAKREITCG